MTRTSSVLLLIAAFFSLAFSQTAPTAKTKPEAAELLQQVDKKYEQARYYRIESAEEWEMTNDLYRDWQKTILVAVMEPGNRYRFEVHSAFGDSLKISDGKTETNYSSEAQEYTQQQLLEPGPIQPKGAMGQWGVGVLNAISLLKSITRTGSSLLSPSYLPDEVLSINGQKIPCYVIKGRPKYRGGSPDVLAEITLWIEKDKLVLRKRKVHEVGPVMFNSQQEYVSDQTYLYPVMELEAPSVPDTLFSFTPPAGAELVQAFSDPYHPKDKLAGTNAPDIKLREVSGKSVDLKSFRGKLVLLDFWATWCAPCVASLEPLKKLHEETQQKGLVILNIDEDNDGEEANSFFAKRGLNWTNFHDDDGEIWHSFRSEGGVPFYVLINAEGRIAFSKSGAKDEELRAAISKLGIDLPVKEAAGGDNPKQ